MSKIKELTAHLRRLIEKNYIVDYGIDNELNTVLNQIDIESELMKDTWIKIKSEDDLPLRYFNPMIPIPLLITIKDNGKFKTESAYFYASFKKFFYDTDVMNEVSYEIVAWMPYPNPFKSK